MDKETLPHNWDIVMAFKRLFNSEDGEKVIKHLKDITGFERDSMNAFMTDSEVRHFFEIQGIVRHILHMKNMELEDAQPPREIEELTNEF